MPLEAVMICVDNSDYTRNGDYLPTRFASETDAVNLVCGAKTQQNPENSVGILTTAGDRVEVMVTPTSDLGRMVSELSKINIGGNSDLLRAIQTAQLALKHRQNKNQKQRIIAFVGSPVVATDRELETLGKNLKKNNVSIDLVSFGEVEENAPKLQKLLTAVNSNDTSHMVEVPVGPKLLSDVLLSSVIINPDGEAAGGAGGGAGGDGFEFGINPNDDPELALALRISMEEERARQQQQQAAQQADAGGAPQAEGSGAAAAGGGEAAPAASAATAPAAAPAAAAGGSAPADATVMEAMGMDDMDEELRQALLLSLQEAEPMDTSGGGGAPAAAPPKPEEAMNMDDMDEELRQALMLSLQEGGGGAESGAAPQTATASSQPEAAAKDAPMPDAAAARAPAPAAAAAPPAESPAPAKTEAPAEPAAKEAAPATTAGGDEPAKENEDLNTTVDSRWFQDPSFVQELLGSLPGVDINDPRIQMALQEVGGEQKEGEAAPGGSGGNGSSGSGDKGSSGGGGKDLLE